MGTKIKINKKKNHGHITPKYKKNNVAHTDLPQILIYGNWKKNKTTSGASLSYITMNLAALGNVHIRSNFLFVITHFETMRGCHKQQFSYTSCT